MDSRVHEVPTGGFVVSDESSPTSDEPAQPAPMMERATLTPPPPPLRTPPPAPLPPTKRSPMAYSDLVSLGLFIVAAWALLSGQTLLGVVLVLAGGGVRLAGHFNTAAPEDGPLAFPLALIGMGLLLRWYASSHPYTDQSQREMVLGNLEILVALPILALGPRLALLRRQHVIDRWDALIDGSCGQSDQVVQDTITTLSTWEVPYLRLRRADLAPSILRALFRDRRPFLIVTHNQNHRLKPYRTYIMVRDYGTSLQTCWYLVYRPHLLERLQRNPAARLDLFDEQDLRAYVTAVHHALLAAVVTLLASAGQDSSTLNRTSNGFLGIS